MSIKFVLKKLFVVFFFAFNGLAILGLRKNAGVSFFESPQKSGVQSLFIVPTPPCGENDCKIGRTCVTLT
jgi:hypothetical protein